LPSQVASGRPMAARILQVVPAQHRLFDHTRVCRGDRRCAWRPLPPMTEQRGRHPVEPLSWLHETIFPHGFCIAHLLFTWMLQELQAGFPGGFSAGPMSLSAVRHLWPLLSLRKQPASLFNRSWHSACGFSGLSSSVTPVIFIVYTSVASVCARIRVRVWLSRLVCVPAELLLVRAFLPGRKATGLICGYCPPGRTLIPG
jgi:hypothetical protein